MNFNVRGQSLSFVVFSFLVGLYAYNSKISETKNRVKSWNTAYAADSPRRCYLCRVITRADQRPRLTMLSV